MTFIRLAHVIRLRQDKNKEAQVPLFHTILGFLDSKSFGTAWFWLLLFVLWSMVGRNILGVPSEVIWRARQALRQEDQHQAALLNLLDWLSLTLPRWQLGKTEGAVFMALSTFALTCLGIAGFRYGLELAQAMTLLLVPFLLLFWLRYALARSLTRILFETQQTQESALKALPQIMQRIIWHRRFVTFLSILSVAVTAFWGAIWIALHPFGV